MKRKCVECKYYSLIYGTNALRSGYCKRGKKMVRLWDNKSVACNNFEDNGKTEILP